MARVAAVASDKRRRSPPCCLRCEAFVAPVSQSALSRSVVSSSVSPIMFSSGSKSSPKKAAKKVAKKAAKKVAKKAPKKVAKKVAKKVVSKKGAKVRSHDS